MKGMGIAFDFLCHADFSGRIRASAGNVGLSAFSAAVEALREKNPAGTLLLDAGDAFSVNFWGGRPVVGAVNRMGTDAMTLGNHEFDRGEDFLMDCVAACEFPVLCANIHKKGGGAIRGVQPYTILERQGVKIGVLGLTTEYTPYMVERSAFTPFEVSSAVAAGQRYIPKMRSEGANIIIALTHCPFYIGEDGNISGEMVDVLSQIPAVDACIGGHIPGDYAGEANGACVVKAGFGGASLAHIRLIFDPLAGRVVEKSCTVIKTEPGRTGKPEVDAYVKAVIGPFEAFFQEPIAFAKEHWRLRLATETKLGDFLADCLRFGGKTQLAYMNATSAGGEIAPGVVTRESIIQVAGFNDPIFTGTMTGWQLYALLEAVYEPERFGNNAALLFSGFHAVLDHTRPAGHKVLSLMLPDGEPIAPDCKYTVATSAYMASGGNDTGSVAEQVDWRQTELQFYDAAFAYAAALGTLTVRDWPRISQTGMPENDNSPF